MARERLAADESLDRPSQARASPRGNYRQAALSNPVAAFAGGIQLQHAGQQRQPHFGLFPVSRRGHAPQRSYVVARNSTMDFLSPIVVGQGWRSLNLGPQRAQFWRDKDIGAWDTDRKDTPAPLLMQARFCATFFSLAIRRHGLYGRFRAAGRLLSRWPQPGLRLL